jgi:hypothetical protein
MPGPVVAKSWMRLASDVVAPVEVDTEIFRFPAILDAGPRLVRLAVSGAYLDVPTGGNLQSTPALIKTLGLIKPAAQAVAPSNVDYGRAAGKIRFPNWSGGTTAASIRRVRDNLYCNPTYIFYESGIAFANAVIGTAGEIGNCPAGEEFIDSWGQGTAEPPGFTGGHNDLTPIPYISAGPTEFVASIAGGQREFIIWIYPQTRPSHLAPQLTLCGANGAAPDYAWQAVLEDLGPS